MGDLAKLNLVKWTREEISASIHYLRTGDVPQEYEDRYTKGKVKRLKERMDLPGWGISRTGKLAFQGKSVVPQEDIQAFVTEIYNNPWDGFSGRTKIYDKIKQDFIGISQPALLKALQNLESYQLHLVKKRPSVVRPIVSTRPLQRIQIDLVDMQPLSRWNDGYRYLLNTIDTYTKFAWSRAIKDKTKAQVKTALRGIISTMERTPDHIQSDNGKEFLGLGEEMNIHWIYGLAYTPQSQGQIERFNGTLKQKLFRYMTQQGIKRYIDILPDLIDSYNRSKHTTTGYAPVELVDTADREVLKAARKGIKRQAKKMTENHPAPEHFARGDRVRMSIKATKGWRKDKINRKAYLPQWSAEIYTVKTASRANPQTMTLQETDGQYLARDLMKVNEATLVRTRARPTFTFVDNPARIPETQMEERRRSGTTRNRRPPRRFDD
mgnify:CR=1 FL=1